MTKERYYSIRQVMDKAFKDGEIEEAEKLAHEFLEIAMALEKDWNYGNAIHHANLILGRIAFQNGDFVNAKYHLLEAGKTSGYPQLNSFGPNMMLAKELLEIGEKEIVIDYIDLTKKFWYRIFSWLKINRWKKEITEGLIPDFGANLLY